MLVTETVLFVVLVAVGAMVQSITGFAMGLIIMGGVTALGLADIAFSAAVVSIISLANTGVALRHTYRFIQRDFWIGLSAGLIPCTILGLVLLHLLSQGSTDLLRMLLGIVIILAGGLLMARPHPFPNPSGRFATAMTGAAGGIVTGLYGAGGAPLAWFMYRQPLDVNVIRATLLATFLVSTLGRTAFVTLSGQMTLEILLTALLSVPIVVIVTIVTTRLAKHIPDKIVRRLVFVLLILLGGSLILR